MPVRQDRRSRSDPRPKTLYFCSCDCGVSFHGRLCPPSPPALRHTRINQGFIRRCFAKNCFPRLTGDTAPPLPMPLPTPLLGDSLPSSPVGDELGLACDPPAPLAAEELPFDLPSVPEPPWSRLPVFDGDGMLENDPNRPPPNPPVDEGGDNIPPSPSASSPSSVPLRLYCRFREGGPPPPISVAARLTSTAPGVSVCW